jgi:hypothetical protein
MAGLRSDSALERKREKKTGQWRLGPGGFQRASKRCYSSREMNSDGGTVTMISSGKYNSKKENCFIHHDSAFTRKLIN